VRTGVGVGANRAAIKEITPKTGCCKYGVCTVGTEGQGCQGVIRGGRKAFQMRWPPESNSGTSGGLRYVPQPVNLQVADPTIPQENQFHPPGENKQPGRRSAESQW
jgi:hypothetical protein